MMKIKLFAALSLLLMATLVLAGCDNQDPDNINDGVQEMQFEGVILEIDEDSILVEPAEGESIRSSADRVMLSRSALDAEETEYLGEGDQVRVFFRGGVMESYPAQVGDLERIDRIDE